jgi:hypothetical protein
MLVANDLNLDLIKCLLHTTNLVLSHSFSIEVIKPLLDKTKLITKQFKKSNVLTNKLKDIIKYLYNMSNNVTSTSSIAINASNNTSTESATTNLGQIMNNISANINPKTSGEGLKMLNKPDEIIARLQEGSKQFERQVGRQMTYSEMREMFG